MSANASSRFPPVVKEAGGKRRGPSPPLSDACCPLGLGLRLFFLRKLEDARVGEVGHFPKHQQVVAPEALRTLPLIALSRDFALLSNCQAIAAMTFSASR